MLKVYEFLWQIIKNKKAIIYPQSLAKTTTIRCYIVTNKKKVTKLLKKTSLVAKLSQILRQPSIIAIF